MELLQELLLTAFVAVLFSFLVAKLLSVAVAGGDAGSVSVTLSDVDEGVMEELQCRDRLNVLIPESENRVEFVEQSVERVDQISEEELIQIDETAALIARDVDESAVMEELQFGERLNVGILESENGGDGEVVGQSVEKVDEIKQELIPVASPYEKETETDSCQLPEKPEEVVELQKSEEIVEARKESSKEKDAIEECEDRESKDMVGLVIDDDDDDWEGIERSEAENIFEAAAKYVGSGDKDDLLSDAQMELYGLHKVATEGPCREPQPMALMLSARAKWNAWQKLGNMSPEEAMEQYVALLSNKVPGWREENCSRDGKLEPQEAGTPDAVGPDLSSISGHQTNYTHEKTSEVKSGSEGGDVTGGSSLETQAKE